MAEETTRITIRLPRQDVEFAKAYAKAHGLSMTEVIARHLRQLRSLERHSPSAELEAITGLLPPELDAEQANRDHLVEKHGK
ncbi:hypothetical protein SAMN05660831_00232 [Thiohalospira halophila DSM 15071]|uniref:Ribbon-helix-helix protein, copG family n=1 Tax=Thiohalospira halophila DSM 15071 TaxID=1123397 RepID=A0A1I1NLX4_9GAMM|nr:DUF6364 family protein [Thiohalospira halophila]SFC95733.1 hypothetical protein SAMN05660831_00232 [Thiohalospira halophila DSM 15071]